MLKNLLANNQVDAVVFEGQVADVCCDIDPLVRKEVEVKNVGVDGVGAGADIYCEGSRSIVLLEEFLRREVEHRGSKNSHDEEVEHGNLSEGVLKKVDQVLFLVRGEGVFNKG